MGCWTFLSFDATISHMKVFSLPSKSVLGTLSTGLDIQEITVNNDLIFTASRCGIIEVWLRERATKIGYIRLSTGNNTKLSTVASDMDGQMLFAGSSDGKIQVSRSFADWIRSSLDFEINFPLVDWIAGLDADLNVEMVVQTLACK